MFIAVIDWWCQSSMDRLIAEHVTALHDSHPVIKGPDFKAELLIHAS